MRTASWLRGSATIFLLLSLGTVSGCKTVSHAELGSFAIRTDSSRVMIFRGDTIYFARIGLTFVNPTAEPVSSAQCLPSLEKKINDKWIPFSFGVVLSCKERVVVFEPGSTHRVILAFFAPSHFAALMSASSAGSMDGPCRLRWSVVLGANALGKGARSFEVVSNEFSIEAPPPSF